MKSLVSICIPTYNGARFIEEALNSALAQTYRPLEIVVSDDASLDTTLQLVKKLELTADIPIHTYAHNPSGIGSNWNHCIEKANGEFIKFLFQDDILMPTCIEKMVNLIGSKKSIGLVACKREFIIEPNNQTDALADWIKECLDLQRTLNLKEVEDYLVMDKSLFKSPYLFKSPLNKIGEPSAYLFRKSLMEQIGVFRTDMNQALDIEFCFRVLKVSSIAIITEPLIKFRLHNDQATNVNQRKGYSDKTLHFKLLYQNYGGLLSCKNWLYLNKRFNPIFRLLINLKNKF